MLLRRCFTIVQLLQPQLPQLLVRGLLSWDGHFIFDAFGHFMCLNAINTLHGPASAMLAERGVCVSSRFMTDSVRVCAPARACSRFMTAITMYRAPRIAATTVPEGKGKYSA